MRKSRFSEEQIIGAIKRMDADVSAADAGRELRSGEIEGQHQGEEALHESACDRADHGAGRRAAARD
jgi:hypothetical protein